MKINRRSRDGCQKCATPKHCLTTNTPFDLAHLDKIVQDCTVLKKHEQLYRQQEKFHGFFVIKTGSIKTYLLNTQGDAVITGFYLAGELLGFSALAEDHYIDSAEALTDTEVCRISYTILMEYANKNPVLQSSLFIMLSAQIKKIQAQYYLYPHANAEQKVATFLLDYSTRLAEHDQDGHNFRLAPTQQDIASFLGLTPETISRILNKFEQLKIFTSYSAKQFTGIQPDKLRQLITQ